MQYFFMSFDSEGRLDPSIREKETKLAMEVLPPMLWNDNLTRSLMLGTILQRSVMIINTDGHPVPNWRRRL